MGRKWTKIGGIGAKKLERPESGEEKNPKSRPKAQKSRKNSPGRNRKGSIRDRPPHFKSLPAAPPKAPRARQGGAPIAVLGAGTGLGEAFATMGANGDYEARRGHPQSSGR